MGILQRFNFSDLIRLMRILHPHVDWLVASYREGYQYRLCFIRYRGDQVFSNGFQYQWSQATWEVTPGDFSKRKLSDILLFGGKIYFGGGISQDVPRLDAL